MKTTSYRFNFLDRRGAVLLREDHRFVDDVTALESAVNLCREHAIEIWDGKRRVAMVKKGHAPLDERDLESL
ncbi:MAG: hypothetical protein ISS15_13840 [Alphaproteobacteria bacterium]|nr:hypothetical protein [Alphaproteobacteria bacterium]MBL7098736.1 hypothetical protein [Alphaproteobacteria bacterium]